MRVIVLATEKGGSGKSTLAAGLAVAATQAGERVVCIDADPQGSLMSWGRRREASGRDDIILRQAEPRAVDELVSAVRRHGQHSLVVIDTPGSYGAAATMLLRQANLCIVPCRPTLLDVEATARTVRALGHLGRRFVYVLSQTDSRRSALLEETRALLAESGTVAPGSIVSRAAHQTAIIAGMGVTEMGGPAGQEVADLWAWLKSRMGE